MGSHFKLVRTKTLPPLDVVVLHNKKKRLPTGPLRPLEDTTGLNPASLLSGQS